RNHAERKEDAALFVLPGRRASDCGAAFWCEPCGDGGRGENGRRPRLRRSGHQSWVPCKEGREVRRLGIVTGQAAARGNLPGSARGGENSTDDQITRGLGRKFHRGSGSCKDGRRNWRRGGRSASSDAHAGIFWSCRLGNYRRSEEGGEDS